MPIHGIAAQDFPVPTNSESDSSAKPLGPQKAAEAMQAPEGFRVSVFASEPDVQNPIAMTWDGRGRLWIAENYTYAERAQRFDLSFRDRVLVLEDTNGDGVADRRTVFTDQVQMLTSVEVGHGGVWLMCPPRVLFIPDHNHDDVPDGPAEVMLDGFEVAQENYHNFANGLRWGPDGWLYGRCGGSCPGLIGVPGTPEEQRVALEGGIWRFHPQRRHVEVLTHGTTNPWGHDWNAFGEAFFINTVNGHLWHLIPGAHLDRPFTLDPNTKVYELLDMHADHWHFDTGKTWQASRDGVANSFGGGHAHQGAMIYLGDNWPDRYRDRLFTWNFHGHRANQEILERRGSGYVARHGEDVFLSGDPFFRGLDLNYGPDGAVYVMDWSDIGECHESTGVHRTSGRVFRVAYGAEQGRARESKIGLRSKSSRDLVGLLALKNEWFARQARLVLAERAAAGDDLQHEVAALKQIVTGPTDISACRALLTLHAIGSDDREFLLQQLHHRSEHLRAWAVRLLTDGWPIDDVFGPLFYPPALASRVLSESNSLIGQFCAVGQSDCSALVRLVLASTIQRLPVALRPRLAEALMSHSEDAWDHNLPLLVWYGLIPVAEDDPLTLARLATKCTWRKTQRLIARRLAEDIDTEQRSVEELLAFVAATDDIVIQNNILSGIEDGLRGWRKAPKPANWDAVVSAISSTGDWDGIQTARALSVVFGDGRALDEVRRIVLDESADIGVRRSALETMVESRTDDIRDVCLRVLDDARLNVIAAKGLSLLNDPEIGVRLVRSYRKFRGPERPKIIAILVSRKSFAASLMDAIADRAIPATDLTAFDVRQIRSLEDEALTARVTELWGDVRESSADKLGRIVSLKKSLTSEALVAADKSRGRMLFEQTCAKCHRMYGQGESVGPDLTGSNRNNLDYLLENIVDPSAVVSKDFRMSVVVLYDGRVMNGLVVTKTDKTLALQTQTDRQTIVLDDVEFIQKTNLSPMPDGLLDNLSSEEIRDLLAYLMHPSQVAVSARPE